MRALLAWLLAASAFAGGHREFNNGSINQATVTVTSAPPVEPFTVAMWVRLNSVSTGADQVLLEITDTAAPTSNYFRMWMQDSDDRLACRARKSVTVGTAFSSGAMVAGQWTFCACVFASTTSRTATLDTTQGATETTTVAPDSMDTLRVGNDSTLALKLVGRVAYVAWWGKALSATELDFLAGDQTTRDGVQPNHVYQSLPSLKGYWRLDEEGLTDAARDRSGAGLHLTVLGNLLSSDDAPPVWIP
jgi:hypothetical protein